VKRTDAECGFGDRLACLRVGDRRGGQDFVYFVCYCYSDQEPVQICDIAYIWVKIFKALDEWYAMYRGGVSFFVGCLGQTP